MLKRIAVTIISAMLFALALCGCSGNNETPLKSNFKGLGFEWDIFDINENWTDDNYQYIIEAADYFAPSTVRTMLDIDKFVTSFDDDNIPVYNFQSDPMKNLCDILDYCQQKNITVAIGLWHARHEGSFVHDVLNDEGNPLFAEIALRLAKYLINDKNYSCIKYIVPYNEPNYTRRTRGGATIDAYTLWTECMENFIQKIPQMDFKTDLQIAAPDCTSWTDSSVWIKNTVRDFDGDIGLYQMHIYPSSYIVNNGGVTERLQNIIEHTKGKGKEFWIYESGINDGKADGIGQTRISTFEFALETADMTLQAVLAGADGLLYWSLDAKMHQKDGVDLDFGLLNSHTRQKRPWFYSSALLSRCLQTGSSIYQGETSDILRMIYSVYQQDVFAIAVNRGGEQTVEFKLNKGSADTIYKYIFNEDDIFFSTDDMVTYNEEIKGSFKSGIKVTVPAQSMIVLSTREI